MRHQRFPAGKEEESWRRSVVDRLDPREHSMLRQAGLVVLMGWDCLAPIEESGEQGDDDTGPHSGSD